MQTGDVARARQETPGCAHVLHFNNAGASLMPQPVIDTKTETEVDRFCAQVARQREGK